jgi:hypothetical protein
MDKEKIANILFKGRSQTNAKAGGQVIPAINGTEQTEYAEGDWLYRDIYFNGKNSFSGIDAVYFQGKPVWASSYFGKFKEINEEKLDEILRRVIIDHPITNAWQKVELQKYDDYEYENIPDSEDKTIDEVSGVEQILKDGKEIYTLYYAGGILV